MGNQQSVKPDTIKESNSYNNSTEEELQKFAKAAKTQLDGKTFPLPDGVPLTNKEILAWLKEAAISYSSTFSVLMKAQQFDEEQKEPSNDDYSQMLDVILDPLPDDSMEVNELTYSRKMDDVKRIVEMYKQGDDFKVIIPFSKSFEEVREVLAIFGCRDKKLEKLLNENCKVLTRALCLIEQDATKGYLQHVKELDVTQKGLSDACSCKITLDLDYGEFVKEDDDFKRKFLSELSRELKIDQTYLKIERVQRGSVIVVVTVLVSIAALCLAGWASYTFAFDTVGLSKSGVAIVVALVCGGTGAALGAGIGAGVGAVAVPGVGAPPGAAIGAGVGGAGGFVFGLLYVALKDLPQRISRVVFSANPLTQNYEVAVEFHDPRVVQQ